jgi:hypothetical protein
VTNEPPKEPRPVSGLDISVQRPWRLGETWSAAAGFAATVVAKGDGPPDAPGSARRQGDLLLFATERTLATALVAAHNAMLDRAAGPTPATGDAELDTLRSQLRVACAERGQYRDALKRIVASPARAQAIALHALNRDQLLGGT